jgi:hypothetical protein
MALTAAPTVGGLAGTASARAAQETGAVVAGLKAQQDAALAQAAHRAAQQGQLATAASTFLDNLNLGGQTAGDYANAAAAQVAAAQGFQGGLQQTVSDAASEVQRGLAAAGSSQTALNQGQAAGNALYGLGGYLPSAQLGVVGPSVAASMRTLPAMTLGYGQQLAAGALGAGQQAAAAFGPDIAAALARQPALAASYLDALQDRARQAAQDRADNAYRQQTLRQNAYQFGATQRQHNADARAAAKAAAASLKARTDYQNAQLGITAAKAQAQINYQNARLTNDTARIRETAAHNTALEKLAAQNAANLNAYRQGQIDLGTFNANTSRINSQTSRINAQTSRATALTKAPSTIPTAKGQKQWNPATGRWDLIPGTAPAKTTKGPGGLSASSYATKKKEALDAADLFYYGDEDKQIAGLTYQQALSRLLIGYSLKPKDAAKILAEFYAPGERGRPAIFVPGDFGTGGGGGGGNFSPGTMPSGPK